MFVLVHSVIGEEEIFSGCGVVGAVMIQSLS